MAGSNPHDSVRGAECRGKTAGVLRADVLGNTGAVGRPGFIGNACRHPEHVENHAHAPRNYSLTDAMPREILGSQRGNRCLEMFAVNFLQERPTGDLCGFDSSPCAIGGSRSHEDTSFHLAD